APGDRRTAHAGAWRNEVRRPSARLDPVRCAGSGDRRDLPRRRLRGLPCGGAALVRTGGVGGTGQQGRQGRQDPPAGMVAGTAEAAAAVRTQVRERRGACARVRRALRGVRPAPGARRRGRIATRRRAGGGARGAGAAGSGRLSPAGGGRPADHPPWTRNCPPSRAMGRDPPAAHRAGPLAVIGRPNVGKSTVVTALVGANASIVSNRPQTTRHRLLGIATMPAGQIVLVDTPGLHLEGGKRASSALNRVLNRAARGALEGVDAAALVVEAGRWDEEDTLAYDTLHASGLPLVLVVNQVDRISDKATLLPYLQRVTEGRSFAAVHPVSALKRTGLDTLVASLLAQLPEQPPL